MSKPIRNLVLEYAGATDLGLRRENNEDAWSAGALTADAPLGGDLREGKLLIGDGVWLAVSDGLGGANAGEIASQMAIIETAKALRSQDRGHASPAAARAALLHANAAILQASLHHPARLGMGATLSFLWLERNGAVIGQVGDSRIYRMRAGWLEELSVDHSPVGRLRQSGRLSEADARRHPSRHVIDQCLGGGDAGLSPDCEIVELRPEDTVLLCSDGLNDGVRDSEIAGVLAAVGSGEITLAQAARELIVRANQLSGRDNVTVIVARCRRE